MNSRRQGMASKGGGFLFAVGLSAAVGMVSIPVVISRVGAEVWASIAVGQAVGTIGSALVTYGWPITGPAAIAAASSDRRGEIVAESLLLRAVFLGPVLIVLTVVVWLLTGSFGGLVPVTIAAMTPTIGGLTASWIFVGEGRPRDLAFCDVLPRAIGSILGVLAISLYPSVGLFVVAQMIGQIGALVCSYRSLSRRYSVQLYGFSRTKFMSLCRQGFPGFVTSIVSTSYQNLPVTLVGSLAPSQLPVIAMADKFYRLGQLVLVPVTQVAQGYVPAASTPDLLKKRAVTSLWGALLLGAVVGSGYAVLAGWVGRVLSHGEIHVPLPVAISFGSALALTLMSSTIGRACLVALGRVRVLATSSLFAAFVGIGGVVAGTSFFGATGAGVAIAVAEAVAFSILLYALVGELADRE